MSDSQNHTSIDDLVELHKNPSPFLGSGSPEGGRVVPVESQANPHLPENTGDTERELHETNTPEMHEVIEHEHEPDPEVEQYVNVRKETAEVPPDLKKIGVQASTPQHFIGYQKVQLPISDDEILKGQKKPVTDSLRWLAEFCVYLLKRAHIQLKIAHGKAQRVFRR